MAKQMSLVAALKDYFGLLPDQNSMGFMQELKALTPDDKSGSANLPSVGYEITDSINAA